MVGGSSGALDEREPEVAAAQAHTMHAARQMRRAPI